MLNSPIIMPQLRYRLILPEPTRRILHIGVIRVYLVDTFEVLRTNLVNDVGTVRFVPLFALLEESQLPRLPKLYLMIKYLLEIVIEVPVVQPPR